MRCHMCDAELDNIEMDENHKVLPCPDCLDAVHDALAAYDTDEEDA